MLSEETIRKLYIEFGDNSPYYNFELAANAYYLMVTKRYSLSKAVREITKSTIGFRVSDVIAAGQKLFQKIGRRYVPLGYLARVSANVSGGGTLVFSLWFPFYYTDFYPVLRDIARFITSEAGAFSYQISISPFQNHGKFRLEIGNRISEGTYIYQWGDFLCYFEIEIQKNCSTGRILKKHSVMIDKCKFIGPLIPSEIPICVEIPPVRFVREPWMLSDKEIERAYAELFPQPPRPNYDLFRIAIIAYQLMVERDYSLYAATQYMSRLTGLSATTIREFMIRIKLVGEGYPPRSPRRKYDPYGFDVTYSAYTKESEGKKSRGTALELRFTIWQPFYSRVPFENVMNVVEVLFNSLGSLGLPGESIVLGIIRSYGGESIEDLEKILQGGIKSTGRQITIFRNRDTYTITLVKHRSGEAWRYDGIMDFQWQHNQICYLQIETLRLCGKRYGMSSRWERVVGGQSIITDTGFAVCEWAFDNRLRYSRDQLNFNTLCSFT